MKDASAVLQDRNQMSGGHMTFSNLKDLEIRKKLIVFVGGSVALFLAAIGVFVVNNTARLTREKTIADAEYQLQINALTESLRSKTLISEKETSKELESRQDKLQSQFNLQNLVKEIGHQQEKQ